MTILEQSFMESVPVILRDIAAELKRANDLKERELAVAESVLKAKETCHD